MTHAHKNSWKTLPMPREANVLEYSAEFSLEDFAKISRGSIPQEMEDKWFVYLDGNTLSLHRSWTGICIYQVEFAKEGEKYVACRALVNRDKSQNNTTDDAYDARLLHFLISAFLLGKQIEFPMPAGLPSDAPRGLFQHHVAGSACPEKSTETKP